MDEDDECMVIFIKQVRPIQEFEACLPVSCTVAEAKAAIEEQHEIPAARQRLIWRGRVLHDEQSLADLGVTDGQTFHLALQDVAPRAAPVATQPQPETVSIPGLGVMPVEMMRAVSENPLTQSLLNNPDVMREILLSMPGIKEAVERSPELRAQITDPDNLRQMSEVVRNPAALQQMGRSMEQQMAQISNLPGGERAIERAMTQLYDPLESIRSQHEQEARAREDALDANRPPPPPAGTPLPSPWAAGASAPQGNPMAAMMQQMMGGAGGAPNPALMQAMQSMMAAQGGAGPLGGMPPVAVPAGDPAVLYQSQLRQLADMGFTDRDACIAALRAVGGVVDAAVERLVRGGAQAQ